MERHWNLTPRLRLAADRVPQDAALADIGTDHAYLPVWLARQGRLKSCIASDLRPEPLRRAEETVRRSGAEGIRLRLCDGLSGFTPEEADTIVIAGLGGENIAAILGRAPWTADGRHTLILQPMTRHDALRRFLAENGYVIRREALAEERGILYPVLEAAGGTMRLSKGQLYGGAALHRDPLWDRYLIENILRLQNAIAGRNRAGGGTAGQPDPAEELRDIVTELLEMREARRRADSTGD